MCGAYCKNTPTRASSSPSGQVDLHRGAGGGRRRAGGGGQGQGARGRGRGQGAGAGGRGRGRGAGGGGTRGYVTLHYLYLLGGREFK